MNVRIKIFSYYFKLDDLHSITVMDAEKQAISRALKHASGNLERAASLLQIKRKNLVKKLKDYSIDYGGVYGY
ncbi:MAG: hypothetical protein HQK89_01360 [Nitrospirae bacterium]|nr:hypothetical protein [Nitrospirota bacterium]